MSSEEDSDSDSSTDSSSDSNKLNRQNAIEEVEFVRYYNPSESGSFVDHKCDSIVFESTAKLNFSGNSGNAYAGRENLHKMGDSGDKVSIHTIHRSKHPPKHRQSCPTKLVANKFNKSSLTTINVEWDKRATPVHSSCLDLPILPANTLPAPDELVAELLYNTPPLVDNSPIDNELIKPPLSFRNSSELMELPVSNSPELMELPVKNIGFRNHSINSDKPRRSSSNDAELRRCVSFQYIQIQDTSTSSNTCPCCHSPRSSDSGMAGSYTLASPHILCDCERESDITFDDRYSLSIEEINRFKILTGRDSACLDSTSDFESQRTSPFGFTPRTSAQPSITSFNLVESTESATTSVTSSLDLNPLPTPKPWESENQIHRKLATIRRSQSSKAVLQTKKEDLGPVNQSQGVYRSGMYAHWWLKAKIPANVVLGIAEATSSGSGSSTTAAGKGFVWCEISFCVLNVYHTPIFFNKIIVACFISLEFFVH